MSTDASFTYEMPAGNTNLEATFAEDVPEQEFTGGSGTEEDPWLISEPRHLNNIRNYLGAENENKHFKLLNDIDLMDYLSEDGDEYNDGAGWRPIGDDWTNQNNKFFAGTLDGDGKIIKNLRIDRGNTNLVGLFGSLSPRVNARGSSKIINLHLEQVLITGNNYTGGLAGFNAGEVINCSVEGVVLGKEDNTGGLVGITQRDKITGCFNSGTVTGEGNRTGGMVGYTEFGEIENSFNEAVVLGLGGDTGGLVGNNSSKIENSYNIGNVIGSSNYTGGLIGYNRNGGEIKSSFNAANVTGKGDHTGGLVGSNLWHIFYCYNNGEVTGEGNNTGGLIGYNRRTVTDSYNTSTVNGKNHTGGLVGRNEGLNPNEYAVISKTYSSGAVSGDSDTGGLVGSSAVLYSSTSISFWDTETSNQATSAGGTDKTTVEMKQQSTYPTTGTPKWEFDTIWGIVEEVSYPYLLWQPKN